MAQVVRLIVGESPSTPCGCGTDVCSCARTAAGAVETAHDPNTGQFVAGPAVAPGSSSTPPPPTPAAAQQFATAVNTMAQQDNATAKAKADALAKTKADAAAKKAAAPAVKAAHAAAAAAAKQARATATAAKHAQQAVTHLQKAQNRLAKAKMKSAGSRSRGGGKGTHAHAGHGKGSKGSGQPSGVGRIGHGVSVGEFLPAAASVGAPRLALAGDPAEAEIAWFEDLTDNAVDWGTNGDFEYCVILAGDYVDDPDTFCQARHLDATGEPAGPDDHCASAKDPDLTLIYVPPFTDGLEEVMERARTATVATEPFASLHPVPDYPPADWFDRDASLAWLEQERVKHAAPAEDDAMLRLTIGEDGRVAGYFCHWGVCHTDETVTMIPGTHECWMPEPSPTGYARFHQADGVVDSGHLVKIGAVGNINGHASPFVSSSVASARYADPDAQLFACRCYDDERGGFLAGALVPGVTYGDVALMRRSTLSGDWRWFRNDELQPKPGYDCLGPTLVTRPGLALVSARAASAAVSASAEVLAAPVGVTYADPQSNRGASAVAEPAALTTAPPPPSATPPPPPLKADGEPKAPKAPKAPKTDDSAGGFKPKPYAEGATETVKCPHCQKGNEPDAKFCDQCGFKLAGAEGVALDNGHGQPGGAPQPVMANASPLTRALYTRAAAAAQRAIDEAISDPTSDYCVIHRPFSAVITAAASDSAAPYGNVDYADPGYQADHKKRYPVDTEAHVRAAWAYINNPDNVKAAGYSDEQVKSIKSKIQSAGKKFGIDFSSAPSGKAAAAGVTRFTLPGGVILELDGGGAVHQAAPDGLTTGGVVSASEPGATAGSEPGDVDEGGLSDDQVVQILADHEQRIQALEAILGAQAAASETQRVASMLAELDSVIVDPV